MDRNRTRAGVTFVEVIIALSIIAILAGAMVPRIADYLAARRDEQRIEDIRRVQAALEKYHAEKGVYPPPSQNATFNPPKW